MILGIDPGPFESAWLILRDGIPVPKHFGKEPNDAVLERVKGHPCVAIEICSSYGKLVGAETFETCFWAGRYAQAAGAFTTIYRRQVMAHLCNSASGGDDNIKATLIERFGPMKHIAVGTAKERGPLFGITGDVWAALGVALTYADQHPSTTARH